MNLNVHRYSIGVRLATAWLLMMTIVALLAHLIANDKPLYAKVGIKHFFPAFSGQEWYSENIRFKDLQIIKSDSISIIMPMIPYAPGTSDADNANFKSPFDEQVKSADGKLIKLKNLERHILGTGQRGEDVSAGLIYGTRTTLITSLMAALLSGIIGIVVGAITGFVGNNNLKVNRGTLILVLIGLIPAWFYGFTVRGYLKIGRAHV